MTNTNCVEIGSRWETSATVNVDSDWFGTDLTYDAGGNQSDLPRKHTIQIMMPTSSVVNIQLKKNSITKTLDLNGGSALTGNAAYQFDLMLFNGMSYNIRHKTGAQNVACIISESFNTDI